MKIAGENAAVCFVSNAGYVQHFYVALLSFLKTNPGQHDIFLFNEDIAEATINELKQFTTKHAPQSVLHDAKLDTSRLNHFTGYWEKLGKQVFHRLLITDLLPKKFKYALYLDADIVVYQGLNFDGLPLSDYSVFAVEDAISHILAPKRGLPNYFNAGIMLLNVSRWIEKGAVEKLLNHKPVKTLFAEQELLNEVFASDWFALDKSFNYGAHRLHKTPIAHRMSNGSKPRIIHYVGPIKPWLYWVKGSFLYWYYVWQTPFRGQVLTIPKMIFSSIKHKLRNIGFLTILPSLLLTFSTSEQLLSINL
jgi:lipopolysaccharide biosynthesis glycosyltransferase